MDFKGKRDLQPFTKEKMKRMMKRQYKEKEENQR